MDTGTKDGVRTDIGGEGSVGGLKLSREEIGAIVECKEILKKIGHGGDLNISKICEEVGVSRKSAYGYRDLSQGESVKASSPERVKELESEVDALKSRLERVELENGALRLTKMLVEDLKKKKLI